MFLSRLRSRERIAELMDDPAIDPAEHRHALAGLSRLNRFSNSVGVLWPPIAKLASEIQRTIRVLDVATGSGDVPRQLLTRAQRARVPLQVTACDVSATAIAEAKRTPCAAEFVVRDALREPLPTGFDVVTCSLFLHHLSEDEGRALLANMQQATNHLVLVNDLSRSRFNFCAVWVACQLLTRSRVVHYDGPASVRSALTPQEALSLATEAGLVGAQVQHKFPARFLLSWRRT